MSAPELLRVPSERRARLQALKPAAVKRQRHRYHDCDADEAFRARCESASLLRGVPRQWSDAVKRLKPHGSKSWDKDGAWLGGVAYLWREKIAAFAAAHGDALRWDLADSEICQRARDVAAGVVDLLSLWASVARPEVASFVGPLRRADVPLTALEKMDVCMAICERVGVDAPKALTVDGAVARCESEHWWRRVLRRKVARVVEAGAIKLGLVNARDGGYCSDAAVHRRGQQLARNAAMLDKRVMRNEAGQYFKLSKLVALSTSNPVVRGGELMARIRGCEGYAEQAGHVGTFWTLTAPSRFHAMTVGSEGKRGAPRKNSKYDGCSTPRDAQAWLCAAWARVRASLARLGVKVYGFRVAEPHHDGTPHWHALLWCRSAADSVLLQSVVWSYWLDFEREDLTDWEKSAAAAHRVKCVVMREGGAAGYIAKYVAKSIGHYDIGDHIDDAGGLLTEVEAGNVKGHQRVDAWAATWGIRQFQAIGQPAVTAWRELRRVSVDQIDVLQRETGDRVTKYIASAVHKTVTKRADWCQFVQRMGGMCLPRAAHYLQPAKRVNQVVNGYGETITEKRVVGLEVVSTGRWLVSRRQGWVRVVGVPVQSASESAALAAPWTRFNNCTARLTGKLRAALLGIESAVEGLVVRLDCPPLPGYRPLRQGMYG